MSLTVIQRFYELAKQSSEAPALAAETDGRFQDLPWWFVKSKAKHFGLGLLEWGARPGDFFYLLPTGRPTSIYAELGALTVGLRTLPLPASLPPDAWERLFRSYPPAFFFSDRAAYLALLPGLKNRRELRAPILDSDELHLPAPEFRGQMPPTFRKVFNTGIARESRHHAAYREIRRSLTDQTVMSPVRVVAGSRIVERELTYAHVNNLSANLSRACRPKKIRRLLLRGDLTATLARGAALYWPIYLGIPLYLGRAVSDFSLQLKAGKIQAAYLEPADLSAAASWLRPVPGGKGFFPRWKRRWQERFGWRRHLQTLILEAETAEALSAQARLPARVQAIALDERWWDETFGN